MSFTQDTHPGFMPVRVLQNNVIKHFERFKPGILEKHVEWVRNGKINPGIIWILEKENIRTPRANCSTKQIEIQEVYLSYVWAIAYSLFVIYEQGIQKRMVDKTWNGNLDLSTPLLENAVKLFDWAITITEEYSDWDVNLPNPEIHKNEEEKYFAEKVNGIFLDIIIFNFFHECCHLVNDHCSFIEGIKHKTSNQLTQSEREEYKALESEADLFALETFISSVDDNRYKLIKGIAIILANISNLFISKDPGWLKQIIHPDVDTRLHNALEFLGRDLPTFDYVWYLACFACKIFFAIHKIPVENAPANNSIELLERYLAIFDEIKAK